MIKYLLLGLIVYAYYKFFLAPKRIPPGDQGQNRGKNTRQQDEEYSDYEEVD